MFNAVPDIEEHWGSLWLQAQALVTRTPNQWTELAPGRGAQGMVEKLITQLSVELLGFNQLHAFCQFNQVY